MCCDQPRRRQSPSHPWMFLFVCQMMVRSITNIRFYPRLFLGLFVMFHLYFYADGYGFYQLGTPVSVSHRVGYCNVRPCCARGALGNVVVSCCLIAALVTVAFASFYAMLYLLRTTELQAIVSGHITLDQPRALVNLVRTGVYVSPTVTAPVAHIT